MITLWIDPITKNISSQWCQGARSIQVPRLTYARTQERLARSLGFPPIQRWCDHG